MGAGKGHTLAWMSKTGFFPLESLVRIDPDMFRTLLPEWPQYVAHAPLDAGTLTHKEAGFIQEIAQVRTPRRTPKPRSHGTNYKRMGSR
jgi:hypothetical protein